MGWSRLVFAFGSQWWPRRRARLTNQSMDVFDHWKVLGKLAKYITHIFKSTISNYKYAHTDIYSIYIYMHIIYIQITDIDYNLETVQNSSTILSVPTPIHWSAPLDVEGSEKVDSSFRGLTLRLAQRGCHLAWIYFVSWQKMKKMMGHGKAHGYSWMLWHLPCHSLYFFDVIKKGRSFYFT